MDLSRVLRLNAIYSIITNNTPEAYESDFIGLLLLVQLLYVSHLLTAGRAFALIVLAVMVGPMHMYVTRWRLPAVTAAAGLRHVTRATTTTWALVTLHKRREGTSRRAPTQIAHID